MIYTVRFCHLAAPTDLSIGTKVTRGAILGTMGNTGLSTGAHVHIDVVEGVHSEYYTLMDIERNSPKAAPPRQALYFADRELFNHPILITTAYADADYFAHYGKVHFGFDCVPMDRHSSADHWQIHWPRSMPGTVIHIGWSPKGYGHFVSLTYEA